MKRIQRRHRRAAGFTLVELLVVIGVIALLIGILIPALLIARRQSYVVRCMSNQRQLMAAVFSYAADNDGFLPPPNWDSNSAGPKAAPNPKGWLYDPSQTSGSFQQSQVQINGVNEYQVQTGALYQYLNTINVYRCPQDEGTYNSNTVQALTSYMMNGAVCKYGYKQCMFTKLSQFKGNDILLWEIPAYDANDIGQVNDGADYPAEGITTRHNHGSTLGFADGHADFMTWTQFTNTWFITTNAPGQLWCAPGLADGGRSQDANLPGTPPAEPTSSN